MRAVTHVILRPMAPAEYERWRPAAVAAYADDHVRVGSMPADRAQALAERQFSDLLPEGAATPDQHLLVAELDGVTVGHLWLHIPTDGDQPGAFIYDIEIDAAMRGRGIGRAVMEAGDELARKGGAGSVQLHVFGDNGVARQLYESLGYVVTDLMMAKSLRDEGA